MIAANDGSSKIPILDLLILLRRFCLSLQVDVQRLI